MKNNKEKNKYFTVGSLFAGVGGICLGLQKSEYKNNRFKMLWANEIDEYACETYRQNFNHELLEGDIKQILHPESSNDINYYTDLREAILKEPIDVLIGGFPCQAFSIAGE
ncbi:DNA cytosine methyltransferase, partial [Rothia sp. CCM 9418]|uniref:DNA cytosine methyltransferase n=1 Tax=Rothia sp. CCM 9418 TaxID=3402661 RepID=UPI003AD8E282